jgi:hypothetical protein
MTASPTIQQLALLRRIGAGLGLPPYVLRPRNCTQDVELLCLLKFVVTTAGTLLITATGNDYLRQVDLQGGEVSVPTFRVTHARDQSITVEHWPQEY